MLDSSAHEVARGGRNLAPSACEPTTRRVADVAATLGPGRYTVGLTVRDRGGRRGVFGATSRSRR